MDESQNFVEEETAEETTRTAEKERRRRGSAISGGIFLIGLGFLIITGWWWPGIMFVIGLSGGGELIFRGRLWSGIWTILFFSAIPIVVWIIQRTPVPWEIAGPLLLVGIGVIILARAFILRD
jgi:hypothetical protein